MPNTFADQAALALAPLDGQYALGEPSCLQFEEMGHVLLPQLLSPSEVEAYGAAIEAAARLHNSEERPLDQRDTYGKAFLQTSNLWERDRAAGALTLSKRIAQVAARLLGVSAVRLYHDQALFKEPGGGFTPWHQDQHYWPLATDCTVTAWIPLVDLDESMGILQFASGSHRRGSLVDSAIGDHSEAVLSAFVQNHRLPIWQVDAMQAGDATFHRGWTLHRAPPNASLRMRSVMTIIYYEAGARIASPQNADQQCDLRKWFPGLEPGQAAASPLNPILWEDQPK